MKLQPLSIAMNDTSKSLKFILINPAVVFDETLFYYSILIRSDVAFVKQ